MLLLLHSCVLLPPKSLRSRFGDSERFKPLHREGDRFTADGEEEGGDRETRQGMAGGEKEEGREEGGREKKVLFTEVPWHYRAMVALQNQGPTLHQSPRKEWLVGVASREAPPDPGRKPERLFPLDGGQSGLSWLLSSSYVHEDPPNIQE